MDNEALQKTIEKVRKAKQEFAKYTQEQVDKIFQAAAIAANQNRIPLAKMAVEETGMGVVEDKVIKNHYAAESVQDAPSFKGKASSDRSNPRLAAASPFSMF